MRDEHITKLLDETPIASLSADALARVRAHAAQCATCRHAFAAAQISALLLRERQAAGNVSPLSRLWRTAGALVSAMAVTVAALAALTFVAPPAEQTTTAQETATVNAYTVDDILFVL